MRSNRGSRKLKGGEETLVEVRKKSLPLGKINVSRRQEEEEEALKMRVPSLLNGRVLFTCIREIQKGNFPAPKSWQMKERRNFPN